MTDEEWISKVLHYKHSTRQQEAIDFCQNDPIMQNTHEFYNMTREDQFYT